MRVRPRPLALLLALTGGDYLLWHWSLAGSHDVLALASGLTLLPLMALSFGSLLWLGSGPTARLLRNLAGIQPRGGTKGRPKAADSGRVEAAHPSPADETAELDRLAA